MSKNPTRPDPSKEKAAPEIEKSPQARITQQLVRQLKPYLPIESFEKIEEKLGEIVVENHRLPLKMFAPHISSDLFPIKTVADLEQKLSTGVRRAVSLTLSGSIPVRNESLIKILTTTFQEPKGYLQRRVLVRKTNSLTPASRSKADKGGK